MVHFRSPDQVKKRIPTHHNVFVKMVRYIVITIAITLFLQLQKVNFVFKPILYAALCTSAVGTISNQIATCTKLLNIKYEFYRFSGDLIETIN